MRKLPNNIWKDRIWRFLGYSFVVVLFVGALGIIEVYLGRQWDGQTRFTVVEVGDELKIDSIDPVSGLGIRLVLPPDLEIESVGGRGKWLAGKISKAGNARWVADSLTDYLGLRYTGIKGRLSLWDQLSWNRLRKKVDLKEIKLQETSYLEKVTTPDNMEVYHLASSWDGKARDWFSDITIAQASLGVAIVNTSPVPGLGIRAGRVVESMGFKVRNLSNEEQEVNRCQVLGQESLRTSVPVRKLIEAFNCEWRDSDELDLVLKLGKQYREYRLGS